MVRQMYQIFKPEIFRIILSTFFSRVAKDSFYFIFLLILLVGVNVVTIIVWLLLFKLFEVMDIIDVIGNLDASTRDSNLVCRGTGFLLFLVGTGSVVRVRVRIGSLADGS